MTKFQTNTHNEFQTCVSTVNCERANLHTSTEHNSIQNNILELFIFQKIINFKMQKSTSLDEIPSEMDLQLCQLQLFLLCFLHSMFFILLVSYDLLFHSSTHFTSHTPLQNKQLSTSHGLKFKIYTSLVDDTIV